MGIKARKAPEKHPSPFPLPLHVTTGRVEPLVLPARSPNPNAYAERWVRSVKEEYLSKVILFGGRSLRRALSDTSSITMLSAIIRGRQRPAVLP
jgi:hypothetical protein